MHNPLGWSFLLTPILPPVDVEPLRHRGWTQPLGHYHPKQTPTGFFAIDFELPAKPNLGHDLSLRHYPWDPRQLPSHTGEDGQMGKFE